MEEPTLRDYYAMATLIGLYASDTEDWNSGTNYEARTEIAFAQADAMLKARER